MRVPLSWLREITPVALGISELSDVFNRLGLVVEGVETAGHAFDGVITARVVNVRPHPNADKMRLIDVATTRPDENGELLQIACGAFNFGVGDIVPLATIGTVMPEGWTIERAKKRGEWSNGMLCSARELGLSDDHSGIMILPEHTPLGVALVDVLGLTGPETVFDLAIEANRPDALCMNGVARDVAGQLGLAYTPPAVTEGVTDRPAAATPRATIDSAAHDLCGRFVVAVVRGLRVTASPEWVSSRLTNAGMRPINNIVDASNYVMLELGAPSHPYDLRRVGGGRLGVRWARDGEQLDTLDGLTRRLAVGGAADGVIVDGSDAVIGIAGVMGGASSEIADDTTDVLFEVAWWTPMSIARTAKRLGLRTEASARFERGTDIEALPGATARFVELLRLTCPNLVVETYDDVRVAAKSVPTVLALRTDRVNLVLGTRLDDATILKHLASIGFTCKSTGSGVHDVTVPSWRHDVTAEINLVEEVGRHFGYDNIERKTPANTLVGQLTPLQRDRRRVRRVMVGLGCDEAWTATLLAEDDLARAGLPADPVLLRNPLVAEESALRPSLLPGLLRVLAHNTNHRSSSLRLFECGHVFGRPRPNQVVPYEREMLAGLFAFDGDDVASAKRGLDALVQALGVKPAAIALRSAADLHGLHPTRSALVLATGTNVSFGVVGEIDPAVAESFGVERRVGWLQVDFANLCGLPRSKRTMVPFSRFPSSDVDFAFVADDSTAAADIEVALRRAGGDLCESVSLFDVYRGQAVGERKRSLAYRVRFVAPDRTLNETEIAAVRKRCIDAVRARTGAELRG